MSRGFGDPANETSTTALTLPSWGWGDVPPATWDASTVDYGWGGARLSAFPSYLALDTVNIGNDGGYAIQIRGDFPRRGASARRRPSGFSVVLRAGGTDYACHSGLISQGFSCVTDLKAQVLRGYSPEITIGSYDVIVGFDGTEQNAGSINVLHHTRTREEYALRDALPSVYATGPRRLELDLETSAKKSTINTLTRAWGQSIAEFSSSGPLTRLSSPFADGDSVVDVESTLGFRDSGQAWVSGVLIAYTSKTSTQLIGVSRVYFESELINTGARVRHDSHAFTM